MVRRRVLLVAAALAAIASSWTSAQAPVLRFHHVHVRGADPATAMAKYTRENKCTSVVLQGVGVGVRCGQTYLLFDRDDRPGATPIAQGQVTVSGSGERATVRVRVGADNVFAAREWFANR